MTIPVSEHLLQQAERLLTLFPGKPRQAELRRAVSTAYYAAFHFTLTRASDECIGARYRADPRYALAYRSVSHAGLRTLCVDVGKTHVPDRLKPYLPAAGFGGDIRGFATALADLQAKRHQADDDPAAIFRRVDAQAAIAGARNAIAHFRSADAGERRAFLSLLLFAGRSRA